MFRSIPGVVLGLALAAGSVGPCQAQSEGQARSAPFESIAREQRQPRIASRLQRRLRQTAREAAADAAPLDLALQVQSIEARAAIEETLRVAGGTILNARGTSIEASLMPDAVAGLAATPGVDRIDLLRRPRAQVMSDGMTHHHMLSWFLAGYDGEGIKVGVIDVGFGGLTSLLGREIPSVAGFRCYTGPGVVSGARDACEAGSAHGTAVAETIVDMAPRVSLYIANPYSALDLQDTVEWMASQGVAVINYSLTWSWDGPGDGTSIFTDSPLHAVDLAASRGIVWVNAAGNYALSTWHGASTPLGATYGFLEVAPGVELNAVSLEAGVELFAQLRWDDAWGTASSDLAFFLLNASQQVVAWSDEVQAGSGAIPLEVIDYVPDRSGTYYLAVLTRGHTPAWVQEQAFSGHALQVTGGGHSIGTPGDSASPSMLTVGAIHQVASMFGYAAEPYSGRGPTTDGRVKPDVAGIDGMSTATYGRFHGTSQAAAHVSGIAAAMRQLQPELDAAGIVAYLTADENTDQDLPSPNNDMGHGISRPTQSCVPGQNEMGVEFRTNAAATGYLHYSAAYGCPSAPTPTTGDSWIHAAIAPWADWVIVVDVDENTGAPRTGHVTVGPFVYTVSQGAPLPTLEYDPFRVALTAVVDDAGYVVAHSGPVRIRMVQQGAGSISWTARAVEPWLHVTRSGVGNGELVASIADGTGALLSMLGGSIVVTPAGTRQSRFHIPISLRTLGLADVRPAYGTVDTPLNNVTGVSGALAITGWALDDLGVERVQVWRNAVSFDPPAAISPNGRVYVGEATFVEGARPDVAAAHELEPFATRAGWGMLVLTSMLPDTARRTATGGNGTFTFTVTATDVEGHVTTLGTRRVTVANDQSVRPFGTIDTPIAGATVSGTIANFGWALARPGVAIQLDGQTLVVYLDGVPVGHPTYGLCRAPRLENGLCRDDVLTAFPWVMLNNTGAIGLFGIDTTRLTNGLHTISWGVTDTALNSEGLGSRYFRVLNDAPPIGDPVGAPRLASLGDAIDLAAAPLASIAAATGYAPTPSLATAPGGRVVLPQAHRAVVQLDGAAPVAEVFQVVNGRLSPLPVGASYDVSTRQLAWQPGPAFLGEYAFAAIAGEPGGEPSRSRFTVSVEPQAYEVEAASVRGDGSRTTSPAPADARPAPRVERPAPTAAVGSLGAAVDSGHVSASAAPVRREARPPDAVGSRGVARGAVVADETDREIGDRLRERLAAYCGDPAAADGLALGHRGADWIIVTRRGAPGRFRAGRSSDAIEQFDEAAARWRPDTGRICRQR